MFITLSSQYIQQFIIQHPIVSVPKPDHIFWTPTLAMGELYKLLQLHGQLFTQQGYMNHLIDTWNDFYQTLSTKDKIDLRRRVYRNFYLSGIDQLYVQALMAETTLFQVVGYDVNLEVSGIDIFAVTWTGRRLTIALQVNTRMANYKHRTRDGVIVIKKQLTGMKHGNMYWYKPDDLEPVETIARADYWTYWSTNRPSTAA